MKSSEQLEAIAALLEKGWTQRTWARDRHGMAIHYSHPQAVFFCIDGACRRVAPDLQNIITAHSFIRKALPPGSAIISQWNDDRYRKQKEVIAVVKKAAQLAREEET